MVEDIQKMLKANRILFCLAATMAVCAVARADDTAVSGNPYESIVKRNVFGLNPLPPPQLNTMPPGPPPPKITLTGITTIFGAPEALFKVAGVRRPGRPPQDESYIFTEGEAEDDVEVTAIDVKANTVTFINHGETQVIPLAVGEATASAPPPAPTFPGMRRFGAVPSRDHFEPHYPGYDPNSPINKLSPEDRAALIAAKHAEYEQEGNPMAKLFPPTSFDKQAEQAAQGGGGLGGAPGMPPMPGRP